MERARRIDPSIGNSAKQPARWRFRWRWLGLGLFVLIGAVALGPTLIAKTQLRSWLLQWSLEGMNATVHVGEASIEWFAPIELHDVELRDADGRRLFFAESIYCDRTLTDLLKDSNHLGHVRIQKPILHVVFEGPFTNIEQVVVPWMKKKEICLEAMLRRQMNLQVDAATIHLRDYDTTQRWTFAPISLEAELQSDPTKPITVKAKGPLSERLGTAASEIDLTLGFHNGKLLPASGSGSVKLRDLELGCLEPFLRRRALAVRMEGIMDGSFTTAWGDQEVATQDASTKGRLNVRQFTVYSQKNPSKRLYLDNLALPFRLVQRGKKIEIEQFEIQSDIGKVALTGNCETSPETEQLIDAYQCHATGQIDLRKFHDSFPCALCSQTHLESGTLYLAVDVMGKDNSTRTNALVETSEVAITRANRWQVTHAPVRLHAQLTKDGEEAPVLEQIQITSDFMNGRGSGNRDKMDFTASIDLEKLTQGWVNALHGSEITAKGQVEFRSQWRRIAPGKLDGMANLSVERLRLFEDAKMVFEEPRIDADWQWSADWFKQQLTAGNWDIKTPVESLHVELAKPIRSLEPSAEFRCQFEGNLDKWTERFRPAFTAAGLTSCSGLTKLTANCSLSQERLSVEGLEGTVHALTLTSATNTFFQPSIKVRGGGRWNRSEGRIAIENFAAESPAGSVRTKQFVIQRMPSVHAKMLFTGIDYPVIHFPRINWHFQGAAEGNIDLTRIDQGFQDTAPHPSIDGNVRFRLQGGDTQPSPNCDIVLTSDRIECFEVGFGAGEITARLDRKGIQAQPIVLPIEGGGELRVHPLLAWNDSDPTVVLAPGARIDRLPLRPKAARWMLQYALPVLAEASDLSGTVSLQLDGGSIPLGQPAQSELGGRLLVHDLKFAPGPLVQALLVLLHPTKQASLAPNSEIAFHLVDEKVYHQEAQILLGDILLRTGGWVGLNGELGISVEAPLPGANDSPYQTVAASSIKVPIRGTLRNPKLDLDGLDDQQKRQLREATRRTIEDQLSEGILKLLRK